jgi:hypothetical protein
MLSRDKQLSNVKDEEFLRETLENCWTVRIYGRQIYRRPRIYKLLATKSGIES